MPKGQENTYSTEGKGKRKGTGKGGSEGRAIS